MWEVKLAEWTARLLVAPHPSIHPPHVSVRNSQIFPDMSAGFIEEYFVANSDFKEDLSIN